MFARQTDTLIIGASISGLASAAALQRKNIAYTIIEKQDQIAAPWRHHYERLHLHTSKRLSSLPFRKFGPAIPRYPGRQQLIDYLEDYQRAFQIHPLFHTEALSVKREDGCWFTGTNTGSFRSKYLVMATGTYGKPCAIQLKGMETFPGRILHSCEYKTGCSFKGQRVLVLGFGNSACEIAMDLYEQGALPAMSVRSPVNVVPRDVLGIPVLELSLLLSRLPPRIADAVSAPLIRRLTRNLAGLGLRKMPYGPLEQVRRDGKVPVLDIGTLGHIRQGHITVYGGLDHIEGRHVHFCDGRQAAFDAIVAGIGYRRDDAIPGIDRNRFADAGPGPDRPACFGQDGLYGCGYRISPAGQIRQIASDARKIAKHIAKKEKHG